MCENSENPAPELVLRNLPNLLVVSLANRDCRHICPLLPQHLQSHRQKVALHITASPRNVGTFQTAASKVEKRGEKVVGGTVCSEPVSV
jgi:hypothetical protein